MEVDSVMRGAAEDYVGSITRGLGPWTMQDSFDLEVLSNISIDYDLSPF